MSLATGKRIFAIILLIVTILAVRISISYNAPLLNDAESYFQSRLAQHVWEHQTLPTDYPWDNQPLQYPPLYPILLAPFIGIFGGLITAKILFPLLSIITFIFVYLINHHITKSDTASLFAASLASFIPSYLGTTTNTLTSTTYLVPFFCVTTYFFVRNDIWPRISIISITLLSLLHPFGLVFGISLLVYWILIYICRQDVHSGERDIILFTTLFMLWSPIILYHTVLQTHGIHAIWQNIPAELLKTTFNNLELGKALIGLGLFPFLFGVFALARYIANIRNNTVTLIASQIVTLSILLYLEIIPIDFGLALLGVFFAIMAGATYRLLTNYLERTRIARYGNWVMLLIFLSGLGITILQGIHRTTLDTSENDVVHLYPIALWIRNHAPQATFIAPPLESQFINVVGERKVILRAPYLLIPDVAERYRDLQAMYRTPFASTVIERAQKYNASYFVTDSTLHFGKTSFLPDPCFQRVYAYRNTEVYRIICNLQEL